MHGGRRIAPWLPALRGLGIGSTRCDILRRKRIGKDGPKLPSWLGCEADEKSGTQQLGAPRCSKLKERSGNVYENKASPNPTFQIKTLPSFAVLPSSGQLSGPDIPYYRSARNAIASSPPRKWGSTPLENGRDSRFRGNDGVEDCTYGFRPGRSARLLMELHGPSDHPRT
jgi:hypothetical protein